MKGKKKKKASTEYVFWSIEYSLASFICLYYSITTFF